MIAISLFLAIVLIITLFLIPNKEHFYNSGEKSIHLVTNPSLPLILF